jgi:hypothetical protein
MLRFLKWEIALNKHILNEPCIPWKQTPAHMCFYISSTSNTEEKSNYTFTLIMKAAGTSKTSLNFYQTKRRNNPEDSHPHTRRENLKSHLTLALLPFLHILRLLVNLWILYSQWVKRRSTFGEGVFVVSESVRIFNSRTDWYIWMKCGTIGPQFKLF